MNMFAIFSLRRPDILPVGKPFFSASSKPAPLIAEFLSGDLGVQRGVLRWFVSLHSPSYPVSIRQDKMADPEGDTQVGAGGGSGGSGGDDGGGGSSSSEPGARARATTPAAAAPSIPPAPATPNNKKGKGTAGVGGGGAADAGMALPDAFTPSINKTLNMLGAPDAAEARAGVQPLPEGLTVAQMKTRLGGKGKVKCVRSRVSSAER